MPSNRQRSVEAMRRVAWSATIACITIGAAFEFSCAPYGVTAEAGSDPGGTDGRDPIFDGPPDAPPGAQLEAISDAVTRLRGRVIVSEGRARPFVTADFSGTNIGDEDAASVADLGQYGHVSLGLILGETARPEGSHLQSVRPATRFSERGLRALQQMKNLSALDLRNLPLNDAAFKELSHFRRLEVLNLVGTTIKDDNLRDLHSMSALRLLVLAEEGPTLRLERSEDPVVDQGDLSVTAVRTLQMKLPDCDVRFFFDPLLSGARSGRKLSSIATLVTSLGAAKANAAGEIVEVKLPHRRVTDLGAWQLREIRGLVGLDLRGTFVTDEVILTVSKLGQLNWLLLDDAQITGATLAKLSSCKELRLLSLKGCPISKDCLRQLVELTQLRRLVLTQTNFESEQRVRLRNALPECRIEF